MNFIKRRIEGVLFLLLAAALVPVLLVHLLTGLFRCPGQAVQAAAAVAKRWVKFVFFGFAPIRIVWPYTFKLEKIGDVWRHVVLLEVFDLYNISVPLRSAVSDVDAGTKVLVVKLAHFGDALHIIPMLRSLRAQTENVQVDVLVGPWCESLAKVMPGVDHIQVYRPSLALFHRNSAKGKISIWKEFLWLRKLGRENYDVMISTSTTNVSEVLLWAASRPRRWIGCSTYAGSMYQLHHGVMFPYDVDAYEAQRVSGLLVHLGLEERPARLGYPLPEDDARYAIETLGLNASSPQLAVIAPGAGWEGKRWPVERYAQATAWLVNERGFRAVFVGTPEEGGICDEIIDRSGVACDNLAGKTTLSQLADVIKHADVFIGNDSGPMHLAVAFDRPTVAFFGPTNASKWLPDRPNCEALQGDFSCSGCIGWHVRASCLHDHACMKEITVEAFKQSVERVVNQQPLKVQMS